MFPLWLWIDAGTVWWVARAIDRLLSLREKKRICLLNFWMFKHPAVFPERILHAFLRLSAVLFPFPPSYSLLVFRNRGDASRRFERGHTEFERIGGFVWYASGGWRRRRAVGVLDVFF